MNVTSWIVGTLVWLILAGGVCLGKKNNGLIDIFWGVGFVILASISFWFNQVRPFESFAVSGLVLLWGLRLSFYLFSRNWGKPEDFRYAAWRNEWGSSWVFFSIFKVYLLQALIMQLIAIPIFVVNVVPQMEFASESRVRFLPWILIGMVIAIGGIVLETVADLQKSKFKGDLKNQNKICQVGLWGISRHPNYLGEILTWTGIGIIPLGLHSGLFALIAPVFITLLLYFVSGVPLLEKRLEGRPDFEAYKNSTGAIFPKWTRNASRIR